MDTDRTVAAITRALWAGEVPERVVPDLAELERASDYGGEAWCFAVRTLALALAPTEPWRSALLARRLLAVAPRDHAAWAALGLAQSLLGNHRYAVGCYERALAIAPSQPRYAHNLGHLYDVVLDRPEAAVPLLELAYAAEPRCAHVAASYAHALGRTGRARAGLAVLEPAVKRGATRDQRELLAWLSAEVAEQPEP